VFAAGNPLPTTLPATDLHTKYSDEKCKWETWKRSAIRSKGDKKLTGEQSMSQEPGNRTNPFIITHEGGLKWFLYRLKNNPRNGKNLIRGNTGARK
jgi:hypothetical protein